MTSYRDNFGDLPRDHAEAIARADDAQAAGRRGLTTPAGGRPCGLPPGHQPSVAELERLIRAWHAGPHRHV
jgi:hypothetical protein